MGKCIWISFLRMLISYVYRYKVKFQTCDRSNLLLGKRVRIVLVVVGVFETEDTVPKEVVRHLVVEGFQRFQPLVILPGLVNAHVGFEHVVHDGFRDEHVVREVAVNSFLVCCGSLINIRSINYNEMQDYYGKMKSWQCLTFRDDFIFHLFYAKLSYTSFLNVLERFPKPVFQFEIIFPLLLQLFTDLTTFYNALFYRWNKKYFRHISNWC